jgi:hypothetical protein
MEWVVKLEAKTGWGAVEAIEIGRLERRVRAAGLDGRLKTPTDLQVAA